MPLAELRTVDQVRYVTDSNGVVAFDEPGQFDIKVFFTVSSHGYEAAKDNFGYRGNALQVTEGGIGRGISVRCRNIAERLYRNTGAGIYRDSILTGDPIPIREPLLNGRVMGQDSVVNTVYQGKIHWFWGDTNRPDYPLGNFHVLRGHLGAVTSPRRGLTLRRAVDLRYFPTRRGFAKPTAPMPGDGLLGRWISALIVLRDSAGKERMFANYAKVRKMLTVYQQGLVEFHPESQRFEKVVQFPDAAAFGGDYPSGHAFLHRDRGVEYIYYASPYPLIRVPADPDQLGNPAAFESFTCLKAGTSRGQQQLDRGAEGTLHYGWKRNTQVLPQEAQNRMIAAGRIRPNEALLNLRDVETGKTVLAHGGSVYWNDYRGRWVMIAVESFGSTSFLGEVWFAEADTPLGPWVYARKVVTHDKYSFYNPKQHPMFDQQGGRIIFFEGTYTTTFSGNTDPTPRYDYNQMMYRLDLADRRLALPVPIYEVPDGGGALRLTTRAGQAEAREESHRRVAFFAPDRPGLAGLPVYEEADPAGGRILRVGTGPGLPDKNSLVPLFYLRPDDPNVPLGITVQLYEVQEEPGGRRTYSLGGARNRATSKSRVLGRVWPNPATSFSW